MRAPIPSSLGIEEIRSHLTTHTIGAHLVLRDEVTSTNELASALAEQGAPHGSVIVAETQNRGRGRFGRPWLSPAGMNLYVSILFHRSDIPTPLTWLPLFGALAVRRAVHDITGLLTMLKWPNDVVSDRSGSSRKLAGVLAEATDHAVVLGIGLNVNMPSEALPDELRDTATSVLLESGQPVDRARLLAALLAEVERQCGDLSRDPASTMAEYREACSTLGKQVRVELLGRVVEGRAEGIAADGALCLRTQDGRLLEVRSGEVMHLR